MFAASFAFLTLSLYVMEISLLRDQLLKDDYKGNRQQAGME